MRKWERCFLHKDLRLPGYHNDHKLSFGLVIQAHAFCRLAFGPLAWGCLIWIHGAERWLSGFPAKKHALVWYHPSQYWNLTISYRCKKWVVDILALGRTYVLNFIPTYIGWTSRDVTCLFFPSCDVPKVHSVLKQCYLQFMFVKLHLILDDSITP